jgi:localization factor PodJL
MASGRTPGAASDTPVADAWRGKFLSGFNSADAPESGEHNGLRLFVGGGLALIAAVAISATLFLGEHAHAPATNTAQRAPGQTAPGSTAGPTNQDRLAALANSGSAKAQELLGLRYLDGDGVSVNEAEGAKWLARAAARGEALAAYRLGTLYEHGRGVPADPARAAKWYMAAAKAGNRKAMHSLAIDYAEGFGVSKNPVVAAEWFAHAAELGLSDSQFDLGVLYERGMGVPQSLIDAYKWYEIAAARGDPESRARIETLGSELGAEDKAAATQAAAEFRAAPQNRAANMPPDAATLLGG